MKRVHNGKTSAMIFVALAALAISPIKAAKGETLKQDRLKKKHTLLLKSAVENAERTEVTLPIFEGRRGMETVWYVVTESSNQEDAIRRGIHYAPKMANAKRTAAVETVKMVDGMIEFKGTVLFNPERIVVPGPWGFRLKRPCPAQLAKQGTPRWSSFPTAPY